MSGRERKISGLTSITSFGGFPTMAVTVFWRGLADLIDYVRKLRFSKADLSYLEGLGDFRQRCPGISGGFYLSG